MRKFRVNFFEGKVIMNKMITSVAAISLAAVSYAAMAGKDDGTLMLFQKCWYDGSSQVCPNGPGPWPSILPPEATRTGELKYSLYAPEFNFDFKGKGLTPNVDYTLIYYPDPWPGNGLVCLGSGTTEVDKKGKVKDLKIKGAMDTGDLPYDFDDNYYNSSPGAKIWLVLSADVDCDAQAMTGWNPAEYLFEYNPIVYTETAPAL